MVVCIFKSLYIPIPSRGGLRDLHSRCITVPVVSKRMQLEESGKKPLKTPSPIEMPIQEMIDYIVRAGYVVTKNDSIGGFG
jgi:hypothetical protein